MGLEEISLGQSRDSSRVGFGMGFFGTPNPESPDFFLFRARSKNHDIPGIGIWKPQKIPKKSREQNPENALIQGIGIWIWESRRNLEKIPKKSPEFGTFINGIRDFFELSFRDIPGIFPQIAGTVWNGTVPEFFASGLKSQARNPLGLAVSCHAHPCMSGTTRGFKRIDCFLNSKLFP